MEEGCSAGTCCFVAEGCEEIRMYIDPLTMSEEVHVVQELLRLRELAEKMAIIIEKTYGAHLGFTTEYRKDYPRE